MRLHPARLRLSSSKYQVRLLLQRTCKASYYLGIYMVNPMEAPRVLARARNNSCLGQERCHVISAAVQPQITDQIRNFTPTISVNTPTAQMIFYYY